MNVEAQTKTDWVVAELRDLRILPADDWSRPERYVVPGEQWSYNRAVVDDALAVLRAFLGVPHDKADLTVIVEYAAQAPFPCLLRYEDWDDFSAYVAPRYEVDAKGEPGWFMPPEKGSLMDSNHLFVIHRGIVRPIPRQKVEEVQYAVE